MTWTIIARKPRNQEGAEFVVIDRGKRPGAFGWQQWVSATVTSESINNGEWFWGHYFDTRNAAMEHFNAR